MCLPHLFQAVEIDGEPYWDGGYSGNPALFPLIYDTESLDLLLVKINPLLRPGTPKRHDDIMDRSSEITFNASLTGEMRAIAFVSRLGREAAHRWLVAHRAGVGVRGSLDIEAEFLAKPLPNAPPP